MVEDIKKLINTYQEQIKHCKDILNHNQNAIYENCIEIKINTYRDVI